MNKKRLLELAGITEGIQSRTRQPKRDPMSVVARAVIKYLHEMYDGDWDSIEMAIDESDAMESLLNDISDAVKKEYRKSRPANQGSWSEDY